ncbi:MAG: glycosyltransferase family 4 protein [Burkholderiaceae bacterium]
MKPSIFMRPARQPVSPNNSAASTTETSTQRRRVVIVERRLPHYRVPFFSQLRELLMQEGIELLLLIGEGTPEESKKDDLGFLDWSIQIPTHYLMGEKLCWQPFGHYAKTADLVIINHENKLIYNLWLLFFRHPQRLAFWGHGRNMQSNAPNGFKELFKRWTVNKVDWWFAYTDTTAELVTSNNFPRESITVVQNAGDTTALATLCKRVSDHECAQMRKNLRLEAGPVGLYLGSLYYEKRLDFLLESAHRIRQNIPDFQLVVAGAGQEQEYIKAAAAQYPWIHYAGPLYGSDKATALILADVLLNPGAVGLGILDSFVSGTPMFTTDCGLHGPEISYLCSGRNGVMTANNIDAYSKSVVDTLSTPKALDQLRRKTLDSGSEYTVENMANRFKQGILACLSA